MKRIITTLSALALASTVTFAADKPAGPGGGHRGHGHPKPGEIFQKLDANNDGSISEAEFKAGPRAQKDPAKAAEIFQKLDADKSGGVTTEEMKAHRRAGGKDGPDCKKKGSKGGAAPAAA